VAHAPCVLLYRTAPYPKWGPRRGAQRPERPAMVLYHSTLKHFYILYRYASCPLPPPSFLHHASVYYAHACIGVSYVRYGARISYVYRHGTRKLPYFNIVSRQYLCSQGATSQFKLSRPVWYRRESKTSFPGFLNTPNRLYALRLP
jgi:hypothetical protein